MNTTAGDAPTRLPIGGHRDFPAGRHTIVVTRLAEDAYRVVVIAHGGLALDCYTNTFDDVTRLPAGHTNRRAAWEYAQQLIAEFGADAETPAQVAARVTRTAITMPAPATTRINLVEVALRQPGWDGGYVRAGSTLAVTARILRQLATAGLATLDIDLDVPGRRVRGATLTAAGVARRDQILAASRQEV